ncbi:MAG TPA: TonB-dependent receptor [Rhizomicrobium sp.]|jgi:outer membrane receptor protein involved in Fe transport
MRLQHTVKSRLILGTALAGMLAAGWASSAAAQAAASSGSGQNSGQIETVTVTAEKKSEKLQNVAASVTALDAKTFSSRGITDIQDYAPQIPGLSLTSAAPGFQQITLRGISTGQAEPGQTTAIYIDESPVGSANAYTGGSGNTADIDPADIARIEVLKGPQGTLYGAGAMGGLFKYVMQDPDPSSMFGHVSVSGDTVDHGGQGYRVSGTVNLPLDDQLALMVSGYDRLEPGYIDNVAGKKDDNSSRFRGGRAALAWNINDHVTAKVSAIIQNVHDDGSPDEDVDRATLKPIYGNLENHRFFPEGETESLNLYNGTIDGTWGSLNLVSSSTYQVLRTSFRSDATLAYGGYVDFFAGIADGGAVVDQKENTDRFTQELRASDTAFGGALEYQAGVYFTHENDINEIPGLESLTIGSGTPIAFPEPLIAASIKSQYTEYSFFGNATYHFTDRFDVLAGLRLAYDHQNYAQNYSGLILNLLGGATVIPPTSESDRIALYQITPRFKIDDDQMVYAKVATGYRPGGPNAAPPVLGVPQSFAPDKLTSYEVGYKATLFDDKVSFDAALYYNNWKDVQIQTSASIYQYIVNGGNARTQGVELGVAYVPIDGLTLGLNGSYLDANLTSDAIAAHAVNGDRLPFVPHLSGSLTADYRWPLTDAVMANLGGSLNYVGSRISDYSGRFPVTVPSYTVLDLHAGIDYRNFEISLFAKNLNDSRGITALGAQVAVGTDPYSAAIIQPRTIGLQLTASFQ